jgi:hypothetical protein
MSKWFSKINDNFTIIPNELLDGMEELELNEKEIIFVLKLLRHERNWIHSNKKTFSEISEKTIYRRKSGLIKKNVLKKTIVKRTFDETIKTEGVIYDLSPLEEFIYKKRELIKEEAKEKVILLETITEKNSNDEIISFINKKINLFFDNLSEYKRQVLNDNYPKFFNLLKYTPSKKELSEWRAKEYSVDMFNYFDSYLEAIVEQEDTFNGELITPRLSLLISNKTRYNFFYKIYKDKLEETKMLSRVELNEIIIEEPIKKEIEKKKDNDDLFNIIVEAENIEDRKMAERLSPLDNIDEIFEEMEKEGLIEKDKKENTNKKLKDIIEEREKNKEHALKLKERLFSLIPKFESQEFS